MTIPRPTSDDIRRHRNEHECGMQDAQRVLLAEWRTNYLRDMRRRNMSGITPDSLREPVVLLLDELLAFMLKTEEDRNSGKSY